MNEGGKSNDANKRAKNRFAGMSKRESDEEETKD